MNTKSLKTVSCSLYYVLNLFLSVVVAPLNSFAGQQEEILLRSRCCLQWSVGQKSCFQPANRWLLHFLETTIQLLEMNINEK